MKTLKGSIGSRRSKRLWYGRVAKITGLVFLLGSVSATSVFGLENPQEIMGAGYSPSETVEGSGFTGFAAGEPDCVFAGESVTVQGYAAADSINVNSSVQGNSLIGYAAQPGGEVPTSGWSEEQEPGWYCNTAIPSASEISLRASWELRYVLQMDAPADENMVSSGFYIDGIGGFMLEARNNFYGTYAGIRTDIDGTVREISPSSDCYAWGREVLVQYDYDPGSGSAQLTVTDAESGVLLSTAVTPGADTAGIRMDTKVGWQCLDADVTDQAAYPALTVKSDIVNFNYTEYQPVLESARWYKVSESGEKGQEITDVSKVSQGDRLWVDVVMKNNTESAGLIPAHLKLSDDAMQTATCNLNSEYSGLDGGGKAIGLTGQGTAEGFAVTASMEDAAAPLSLGVMLEDDFFHEKQYLQLTSPAFVSNGEETPDLDEAPSNLPQEDLSSGDMPKEGEPGEDVPKEDVPGEDVPREDIPGEDVPKEDIPGDDISGEDVPPGDVPEEGAIEDGDVPDECMFTLDLTSHTLTDADGNLVAGEKARARGAAALFSDGNAGGGSPEIVEVSSEMLEANCKIEGEHAHTLFVTGSDEKISVRTRGNINPVYGNVWADSMDVGEEAQTITFKGEARIGGLVEESMGVPGLNLRNAKCVINPGASVTVYSDSDSPLIGLAGHDLSGQTKALEIMMEEVSGEDTPLMIAGQERILPANMKYLAVLDNVDGTWLDGDITVQTTDPEPQDYVRGITEQESERDPAYSDGNFYGKTFPLTGTTETAGVPAQGAGVGQYTSVRLPAGARQLNISVPTRVVFNVYTNGVNNGDNGFVAPVYELNNKSYSCEDVYTHTTKDGGSVTEDLGRTYEPVEVAYAGIQQAEGTTSQYNLRGYKAMNKTIMDQSAPNNPIVCLEAEGAGQDTGRVPLDEAINPETPVKWFMASAGAAESDPGISKIQLKVPADYAPGGNSKRWYQIPEEVVEDELVLRGHHSLKLSFALK